MSVQDDPTPPRSFSLEEIRDATQNFSLDNVLPEEHRFYQFYRGHLADGSLVAVKRACPVDQQGKEKFEAEMQLGSTVSRHPNVLCLRGFCRTKKELLLVYPLMRNSSLSYNLRERVDRFDRPLDWTTRKQIALGAARGLAHLHNQGNNKIVHRDICASNILLNEHFEAVIAPSSVAVIINERNMKKGNIGYWAIQQTEGPALQSYEDFYVPVKPDPWCQLLLLPNEYQHTKKCTLKVDVFAYGKMLLELITGRPLDKLHSLEGSINDLIDPNLQGNYVEEEAEGLRRLAMLCSHENPSTRPEMSKVVKMLLQRDTSTGSS